jgi:basic membrane protein A
MRMKKIISLAMLLLVSVFLVACNDDSNDDSNDVVEDNTISYDLSNTPDLKIAMITDVGEIDDKSFNQGTWEGIVDIAEEFDKSHVYYQPTGATTAEYVSAIELAITDGADIVVTPGFLFEEAIFLVQDDYPDVYFVLIDGSPHSADYETFYTASNTLSIVFKEEQSGFLAGYAAVAEGYDSLGFFGGMAVPAVIRYGVGYVAGAYLASYTQGNESFEFDADYYSYFGDFAASSDKVTLASSWYTGGVDVIFAAAGGAGTSVFLAAEDANDDQWAIGVDVDQSTESDKVLTSGMKGLANAVQAALASVYLETWVGGFDGALNLGAAEFAVGLPYETSRFEEFSAAEYNIIFDMLAAGVYGVPDNAEDLELYISALGYEVPSGLANAING